jgi:hypothetical protein
VRQPQRRRWHSRARGSWGIDHPEPRCPSAVILQITREAPGGRAEIGGQSQARRNQESKGNSNDHNELRQHQINNGNSSPHADSKNAAALS